MKIVGKKDAEFQPILRLSDSSLLVILLLSYSFHFKHILFVFVNGI